MKISFNMARLILDENNAVLTGSRAFNVHSEISDYDYVCNERCALLFRQYEHTEINGSSSSCNNKLGNTENIKLGTTTGEIINLIVYPKQETVNKFIEVNRRMMDELSLKQLKDKQSRYDNFEFITMQEGVHNNCIINLDLDDIFVFR